MSQLVSALLDELEGKGIDEIEEVTLEIGALTFLGEEQMEFAYEALTKDTMLEGSSIKIIDIEPRVRCQHCGYEGEVEYSEDPAFHYDIPIISCPECGKKPEIVQGKETVIKKVTAREEE